MIAQKLAKTKQFDAIICLGAVIRGATSHFDYVVRPEKLVKLLINILTK